MIWKTNFLLLFLLVFSCNQNKTSSEQIEKTTKDILSSSVLVEADQLSAFWQDERVRIIDFRKIEAYQQEHIPGAVHLWREHIEDSSYPYSGIMATAHQMEALLGARGISDQHTLVVYDDNGLCDASRLWWILSNYDFNKVLLLNGGIEAWKSMGGAITKEIASYQPLAFNLPENPSLQYLISKDSLEPLYLNKSAQILDVRTHDEYTGKRQKKGARRAGRIPGSLWMDWSNSVNYHSDKKFKSLAELDSLYAPIIDKNNPIIVYCHSGVRSAHTTFVLTQLLGFKNVKNYDGSWLEWSYLEQLPTQQDSITIIRN